MHLNNINVIRENGWFCLKYILSKITTNHHSEVQHVHETRWSGRSRVHLAKNVKTENRLGMPNLPFLTAPATYVMHVATHCTHNSPTTNRFRLTTVVPAVLFAVHVYISLLLRTTGLMVRTDPLTPSVTGTLFFRNV